MPLIATQIDQTDAPFEISGPIVSWLPDIDAAVIEVTAPWGETFDVMLDMDAIKIEQKRLN